MHGENLKLNEVIRTLYFNTCNKNISYLILSHMDPTSTEALIISKGVFFIPCWQKPISYDIGCPVPTVSNKDFFFLIFGLRDFASALVTTKIISWPNFVLEASYSHGSKTNSVIAHRQTCSHIICTKSARWWRLKLQTYGLGRRAVWRIVTRISVKCATSI